MECNFFYVILRVCPNPSSGGQLAGQQEHFIHTETYRFRSEGARIHLLCPLIPYFGAQTLPSGRDERGKRKGLVNNLTPWIHGISLLFNTYKLIAHTLNVKPRVHTTHSHEFLFTTHTYLTFTFSPINADGRNAAVDPH